MLRSLSFISSGLSFMNHSSQSRIYKRCTVRSAITASHPQASRNPVLIVAKNVYSIFLFVSSVLSAPLNYNFVWFVLVWFVLPALNQTFDNTRTIPIPFPQTDKKKIYIFPFLKHRH